MALARTLAHSHIRALALARAPALALRPVASPAARALVHSTASAAYPPKATSDTTNLAKGAGSGKGSRADKDRARADRERARADRERAKADREKVRAARKEAAEKQRQLRKDREEARKAQAKLKKEREQERKHKAAERQKELRERAREREQRKKERELAQRNKLRSTLKPPKRVTNKWQIFIGDLIQEHKNNIAPGSKMPSITTIIPEAKARYAQLSPSELSALDQRVEQARADYGRMLAEWQKTLTPDMIREENLIRYRRRRAGLSRKANLHVPGEPKKPMTPFFRFSTEVRERQDRDVLGDETSVTEQSKLLARAWRALSPEQKKSYEDQYKYETEQYKIAKAKFDAQPTVG